MDLFKTFLLIIFTCAIALSPYVEAQIYKCELNGKTVFTDQPCNNAEEVTLETLNISESSPVTEFIDLQADQYSSHYWYQDATGYKKAKRKAELKQAPMIVYFRTDWCPFCIAVEKNVLTRSNAKAAIKPFVKVRINPEHGPAEDRIFKQMGGTGYPTFLIKPHDGRARRVSVTPGRNAPVNRKHVTVQQFVKTIEKNTPLESLPIPKTPEGLYERSMALYQEQKFDYAERYVKAAIIKRPEEISYYQFLNILSVQSKNWLQSIKYWSQYIELVPGNAEAHVQRGKSYYYQGNYEAARLDAEQATELGSIEGQRLRQDIIDLIEKENS